MKQSSAHNIGEWILVNFTCYQERLVKSNMADLKGRLKIVGKVILRISSFDIYLQYMSHK